MMNTKIIPPKVSYSIREACQATSLSRSSIYVHLKAGRLRSVQVGGRRIIPADALQALISGQSN
ncbi:helix-turn-helix domain-containing protein [Silvimonas sp.]|uniref:helix-turn-helix domain-containing protein n=1 Tax=Silvimonas sp. TaxID=2650811 RepID=UPI003869E308